MGRVRTEVFKSFSAEIMSWMLSPAAMTTKKFHAATVRDLRPESVKYRSVDDHGTLSPFWTSQMETRSVPLSVFPSCMEKEML